ncbi:MAG: hypothetical protein AAB975_04955, partial [Patescibacteria group bacterium]
DPPSIVQGLRSYEDQALKRIATVSLQILIALIGIGTLVLLLWEPHIEGRNAHAQTVGPT